MRKSILVILLIFAVLISGCFSNINPQKPNIKGQIVTVNNENNELDIVTASEEDGLRTFTLMLTNQTQLIESESGQEIDLNKLNIADKAVVWFASQTDKNIYIAKRIEVSRVTQSSLTSEMVSADEGKYNIYIFKKESVQNNEERLLVTNRVFGLFVKKMSVFHLNAIPYQRIFNLSEEPTILVLDNEGVVLRSNDFNQVISFFEELTKDVQMEFNNRVLLNESKHWKVNLNEGITEIWRNKGTNKESYENSIKHRLILEYKGGSKDLEENEEIEYNYKNSVGDFSGKMKVKLDKKYNKMMGTGDNFSKNNTITSLDDQFILTIKWKGLEETLRLKLKSEST